MSQIKNIRFDWLIWTETRLKQGDFTADLKNPNQMDTLKCVI